VPDESGSDICILVSEVIPRMLSVASLYIGYLTRGILLALYLGLRGRSTSSAYSSYELTTHLGQSAVFYSFFEPSRAPSFVGLRHHGARNALCVRPIFSFCFLWVFV
jgi:hypothetical protein